MAHQQNPECTQAIENLSDGIERLNHAVFGNGKPGLKTDVELLKMQIGVFARFSWLIIGGIVTSAIGTLASLAILLVKLFAQN